MTRAYTITFAAALLTIGTFVSAFQYTPPGGGGSGTPSGPAGGSLAGTYPNPSLASNLSFTGIPGTDGTFIIGDQSKIVPFQGHWSTGNGLYPTYMGFGGEFIGTGLNDMRLSTVASYTGSAPAAFIVKIQATGSRDSIIWAKDNGAFSSPVQLPATINTNLALGSEGFGVRFQAITGHTVGDYWVVPTMSGTIWQNSINSDTLTGVTSALAGLGAGNVTNGAHAFKVTWASSQGETYSTSAGSVTVTNNAANGQIAITGIPQPSSSTTWIGANIWATKAGGSTYYLAAFVPKGTTSYTFNTADAGLTAAAPAYLDTLTTAGGCLYGELAGVGGYGSCAIQTFDYGARFPVGYYFFDQFLNGILGTSNGFLTQLTALPNGTTATTQSGGDNSTKVATTAYVDSKSNAGAGTFATLPGTCATGYLYVITDPGYDNAYCSSTNTYTYHLPFIGAVTPPSTLSFSWVNQTSATISTTYGWAQLDAVNNGSSTHKWKLRVMSIPTPANLYTITMWFNPSNLVGNGQGNDRFAVVIYDSGSGKFNSLDLAQFTGTGQNWTVTQWTNSTTFSSQLANGSLGTATFSAAPQSKFALRVVTDSTNTTYYFSVDGVNYTQLYQQTKNTFVTPDSVGFGVDAFDANLSMQVYSFKLTQP